MENAIVQLESSLEAIDWKAKRAAVLEAGKTVVRVTNNDEVEIATKLEKDAKKLVETMSEKRLELTRPLEYAKKAIIAQEKREIQELNTLIDRLDALVSNYVLEQARKAEEERRRIEAAERAAAEAALEAQRKAEEEAAKQAAAAAAFGLAAPAAPVAEPSAPAIVPVPVKTVEKVTAAAASFSEVWKWEILDPNAIPRELCSPDEKKIRAVLAAKKAEGYKPDQIMVQGLRIYLDVQVRAR